MKKQEFIFDDISRDAVTMPADVQVTRSLQYGVWEKLPFFNSLFTPTQLPYGYAFTGWTTVSGGETDYIDGEYVKNVADSGSSSPLYGAWIRRYYYINYNANGGVIEAPSGEDPDYRRTQLVYSVDEVTLPSASGVIKRDGGWQLDGWSKVPYGLVGYEPGSKQKGLFSDFNTGTLYAIWKPAEYTVKFHSNWPKGDADESTTDQTLKYNIISKLRKNTFTFVHWEFVGWATSPTGPVAFIDEQRVVNLSEGEEVNLYARWKQIEFVMTFHKNAPNIKEDDYPVVTDNDITGEMPEEVFELDKPKTIDLNQFVYPKTIGSVETRDRAFNGWLDEPGGYTEEGQGHGRIKWLDGEEIILDHDVDVYAYWDDCIYIEYDATNFKRLKADFERDYPLLAERGIYQLVDRVHPGTIYKVRDDFLKTLYGCNLKAWGNSDGINFQPGDNIPADLFEAGRHFITTPLYNKRIEIYNASDKGDVHIWSLDDTKIQDKNYLNSQTHLKIFTILPRSDYIEEYLDINITMQVDYKDTGKSVVFYWLPESDKDCEWEKLYEVKSGTSKNKYKKSITISVPGWFVPKAGRYVYFFAVVMCPYGAEPGKVENWGDPNSKTIRGWKKHWRKFRHNVTRVVAGAALLTGNPALLINSLAMKSTKNAINHYVERTAKEVAKVKVAGHGTGKAIVKALASKQCQIAIQAAGVITSLLVANPSLAITSLSEAAAWSAAAASACTIIADNTKNHDKVRHFFEAAAIGFEVAGAALTVYRNYNNANPLAVESETWDVVDKSAVDAANANHEINRFITNPNALSSETKDFVNNEVDKTFNYLPHTVQDSGLYEYRGYTFAESLNMVNNRHASEIILNSAVTTAIKGALQVSLAVGKLKDISYKDTSTGLPIDVNDDISGIYERKSDGKLFVKLRSGVVLAAKVPGIDWKPICISSAILIDSIIYPADDQGIIEINC